MVVLKVRRSQVISHYRASNQIKSPSFEPVLVRLFCIDWTEIIIPSMLTPQLDQKWGSRVRFQEDIHGYGRRHFTWFVHLQYRRNASLTCIREIWSCKFQNVRGTIFSSSDSRRYSTSEILLRTDELETLMWETGRIVDDAKEVIFETRVNGKVVLANGRALIITSKGNARLWVGQLIFFGYW